ncbi:MAG: SemiSWEET transporter [Oscillatoria sp. Prado101]|jgi:MtN3 and saliva related transmembrane protein|nr:SemiSWEET transporter [Oscillatoria sp. Prado101]
MDWINILGLTAATLTTGAFVPQVMKTWKSRKAKDVSLEMLVRFCTGSFLWLVYGLLIKSVPVILANLITLMLNLTILGLKIKYK